MAFLFMTRLHVFMTSFSLKSMDFSDNFYLFVINKNVRCNSEGYHWQADGRIVKCNYIVEPTEIPVRNDSCSGYNRESVDISDNDLFRLWTWQRFQL